MTVINIQMESLAPPSGADEHKNASIFLSISQHSFAAQNKTSSFNVLKQRQIQTHVKLIMSLLNIFGRRSVWS